MLNWVDHVAKKVRRDHSEYSLYRSRHIVKLVLPVGPVSVFAFFLNFKVSRLLAEKLMARMKKMRQPSRQVAMRKFNLFALEKIERGRFQARTGVQASPCTLVELNVIFSLTKFK